MMTKTLAAIAVLLASAPAYAAPTPVTDTFTINASSFPANSPFSTITGTFSISFDSSASVAPTTSGLTVSNFTLDSDYSLKFVYSKSRDWLTVGTNLLSTGGCGVAGNAEQFCFIISNASTTFTPQGNLSYSVSNVSTPYASTFTVSRVAAAVPEPAAWAMMILGMGAIGFTMRRRKVITRASYAG